MQSRAWGAAAQWHFLASLHVWSQHRWHGTACDTAPAPALPRCRKTLSAAREAGLLSLPSSPGGPGSCLQLSEHGTEDSSGMKGLCGHFQPINQCSKQPRWRLGCGLGLNDQREHSAVAKWNQNVIFIYWKEHRLFPTSTSPFSSGEAFHLARGTELCTEIIALSDGNHGTSQPLPPPRWSCLQLFPQGWQAALCESEMHLTTAFTAWLCFQPGRSSAPLSWWRAARALGLSLFIAEGSWDAIILLIYTLGGDSFSGRHPIWLNHYSGLLYWPWQLRGH